jgi:catechol-2,3-dioxygenase
MANVRRLNHAVLWVRDASVSAQFYCDVLGFQVISDMGPGQAVFLRANGSGNHHDLGLFSRGASAQVPARGGLGLYHLAWQVDTIDELVETEERLRERHAVVGASDHGMSKSVYAVDPDGIEFEVVWMVPRASWESDKTVALDLSAEASKWSGIATADEANQRL